VWLSSIQSYHNFLAAVVLLLQQQEDAFPGGAICGQKSEEHMAILLAHLR